MRHRLCNPSSAFRVVATMLLAGLLATACSGSPSSSTTTTKLPDLSTQLLSASDMPTSGWTVDTSKSNGGVTGCTLPNSGHNDLEKAESDLQAPAGFPVWEEELVDDAPGVAASDLAKAVASLNNCSSIKITGSGTDIAATIASLSTAPQVGSGSAAWTITAPFQGQTITIFLEGTVFGSEGALFLYGELGNAETDFDSLVQKAADKITGTTPSGATGATGATGAPTGTTGSTTTTSTTGTTGTGATGTTGT